MGSPWSQNTGQQRRRFTTYERDGNEHDEAMFRRYNHWMPGFIQPDPYDGSYDFADPQSFNRYSYVQNDPVNFVDPTGLDICYDENGKPTNDCGPPIDPSDVQRFDTWAPAWPYFLPASQSGHPAFIITLLDSPSNPENVNPADPDVVAVNTALGVCSTTASLAQYSTVNPSGTMWKGRNAQWNRMGWQGNQYTGSRSIAISRSGALGALSRTTGVVGAGFSLAQGGQSLLEGNKSAAAKSGLDATMGFVGAFGGPKGALAAGVYFGVDATIGWKNCGVMLTTPCDRECRRK